MDAEDKKSKPLVVVTACVYFIRRSQCAYKVIFCI